MAAALGSFALALALQAAAPQVQIEARSASGAAAPELAAAISHALIVNGASVILGSHAPCDRCARLLVQEGMPGRYRVQLRRSDRPRYAEQIDLAVQASSPLFERAYAIAIQARLMIEAERPSDRPPTAPGPARLAGRPRVAPKPAPSPPAAEPVLAADTPAPAPLALPSPAPPPALAQLLPESPAAPPLPVAAGAGAAGAEIAPRRAAWPWVTLSLAAGAAAAAGTCGVVAGMHYRALSNRSLTLDQAIKLRDDGKRLQTAGLVLSGPAAVAAAVGILGLVRSPRHGAPSWSAAPIAGGAMITVGGSLP